MGVPAIGSQPRTLQLAAGIGALQAVGLATYAVALLSFEAGSTTSGMQGSDLAPGILVALYAIFAVLVFGVAFLFVTGHASARTPFVLVQVFGLVVAQPLLSGESTQRLGVLLVLASVMAIGCAVSPSARRGLQ